MLIHTVRRQVLAKARRLCRNGKLPIKGWCCALVIFGAVLVVPSLAVPFGTAVAVLALWRGREESGRFLPPTHAAGGREAADVAEGDPVASGGLDTNTAGRS